MYNPYIFRGILAIDLEGSLKKEMNDEPRSFPVEKGPRSRRGRSAATSRALPRCRSPSIAKEKKKKKKIKEIDRRVPLRRARRGLFCKCLKKEHV
ncbi:hypothetical protein PUN28_016721 [Cardiocondyla obscurior]|uniref:Uncharacterized protein n=1 Tax=Cardiocondyla obscurior TaxID=286306 RepID=A0AAW2ES62_9HYME